MKRSGCSRNLVLFGLIASSAILYACGSTGDAGDSLGVDAERPTESAAALEVTQRVRREFVVIPSAEVIEASRGAPFELPAFETLPRSNVRGFARIGDEVVADVPVPAGRAPTFVHSPARASGGTRVEESKSGLSMRFWLEGAADVDVEVGGGMLVYRDALADGADLIHRVSHRGVEDYAVFDREPEHERLRYTVELGSEVAGVRLVSNTFELLDRAGVPRLRVSPPWFVDARGAFRWATLVVSGCAHDTNPAVPWNRPVTEPRSRTCTVDIEWDAAPDEYPIVVDPGWTNSLDMATPRALHAAVKLPDNSVIVAGGQNGAVALSSAEIWTQAGSFTATGSMTNTRSLARGARVTTTGGTTYFVVSGGIGNCPGGAYCEEAERWQYSGAGTWGSAGSMSEARAGHTMSTLTSGPKILAAGGYNGAAYKANGDVYNADTNSWSATANAMSVGRFWHAAAATSSSSSSVVILGGGEIAAGPTLTNTADKYTPSTNQFSLIANMGSKRKGHTATTFVTGGNERVLMVGGQSSSTECARNAQYYRPDNNTWTNTLNDTGPRCYHDAALLTTSNKLFITGGRGSPSGSALATAYTYDPSTNGFTSQTSMNGTRYHHTLTAYDNSGETRAVAIGGESGGTLDTAEWFDP